MEAHNYVYKGACHSITMTLVYLVGYYAFLHALVSQCRLPPQRRV